MVTPHYTTRQRAGGRDPDGSSPWYRTWPSNSSSPPRRRSGDAASAAALADEPAAPDTLGMPILADGAGRTPLKSGLNGDGGTSTGAAGVVSVFRILVWDEVRLVEFAACCSASTHRMPSLTADCSVASSVSRPSAMTMNDPAFRSLISVFFSGRMPLRIWPS